MTVEAPPRTPRTKPADPEALIEEARQRAKRRRLLFTVSALLVLVLGALVGVTAYFLAARSSSVTGQRSGPIHTSAPGAKLLLFGSLGHGHIIQSVRPDGSHLRTLARTGSYDFAPSLDGRRIVFTRTNEPPRGRSSAVFVVDVRSGHTQRITPFEPNGAYRNPQWALGGRRVVYGRCPIGPGGNCATWSIRADGSGARNLTAGLKTDGRAAVSPDGRWIAFSTSLPTFSLGPPELGDLYLERAEGAQRHVVVRDVAGPAFSWSPRGQIVFVSEHGIASVSASGKRQAVPRGEMPPVWSPDGSKLAILRGANLYVRNVGGGRYLRVNRKGKRVDLFDAWSPDGKHIAYSEDRPHVHSSVVVVNTGTGRVESVIPFKRTTWVMAWSR